MAPERDEEIALSRRYREIDRVEPAGAIDEAILAAAKRAVGERPRSVRPGWRVWRVPVSLAAVLVLSVLVTTQLRERPESELTGESAELLKKQEPVIGHVPSSTGVSEPRESRAVSEIAANPPSSEDLRERGRRAAATRADSAPRAGEPFAEKPAREVATGVVASTAEVPSAAAPALLPASPGNSAPVTLAPSAKRDFARAAPISEPVSTADQATLSEASPRETPERWLARIVQLRDEGRSKEADEGLRQFRKRYPDYPIPENLREKLLPR
ncbi:MAG: hypothetical protein OEW21_10390 [Betaproteobacteria bacterium]|nr:hypothetical protein [Betaproteobacteria bacterium]